MLKVRITLDRSQRADLAVIDALRVFAPDLSRAMLKRWFTEKRVRWRGRVLTASFELAAGEYEIEVELPELAREAVASATLSIPVVYEDEDLLILHKPSGVPSVPHSASETETAVGAALARAPSILGVGRGALEPGLLHRLDTLTSGLLVFAKSQPEYERLRAIWSTGGVRKIYRAKVAGDAKPQILTFPLGHDPDSKKRMIALTGKNERAKIRGKPLPTHTHIARVDGNDLEILIRTGVMHQIRASLAAIGHPINGDRIYKGSESTRLWLHAWRLALPLKSGVNLQVEAELPEGWR